jgi:hypothetical protein
MVSASRRPGVIFLAGLLVAIGGCSLVPTASPSATSVPPPESAPAGIGLPPDCQPIDLRDSDGARVDLTGEWEGVDVLAAPDERVWLQQIGDCVYGSVFGVFRPPGDDPETFVVDLGGRLSPDFTVDLDVVFVFQENAVFPFAQYSTMVMIIEWDSNGRIRLREDRDVGERAGRCAAAELQCPTPVIWYRAGEGPSS